MDSPFVITLYDKAFNRKGWVGDPDSLVVTVRHNQQSNAALTVRSDHHRIGDLTAAGARAVITYDDVQIMSGIIRLKQGTGPSDRGSVTVQIIDDFRLFSRVLGWQVPTDTTSFGTLSQGTAEHRVYTGPAETVVKAMVGNNAVARLGLPVTVATDQARGATITVQTRMQPMVDTLLPLVDQAGIGVTVKQTGAALLVDCYTPVTYPRTLTEASGVVQEWAWSQADPDATRVVVGGQGEGVERVYQLVRDTAREAEYGDVIEVHRDARNTETIGDLQVSGEEVLAELAPKAGLSLTLAETSTFRYDPTGAKGVRVGDLVTVEVGSGVTVSDVLRECTLSWTTANGLQVTPTVGERTDDATRQLVTAVGKLARGFRRLTAGR